MALLLTAMVAGTFLIAHFSFGNEAALATLLYLAVPAFFLLYRGLCSDGAYASIPLTAAAVLAATLALDRGGQKPAARFVLWCALGLAVGVGWGVTPLAAAVSAAAFAFLFFRRRPAGERAGLLLLSIGLAVGAFPWWLWNARHGWASLRMDELRSAPALMFIQNLGTIFWTSIPTLEGGVVASPDVRNPGETVMPSRILVLVALAVLLTPAFKAIRQGDRRRLLFGLCLAAIVAAATASGRLTSVATEPRFLFAYYAVMAPLVGAAFTPSPSGGSRRWWRAGALASLILIHFASILVARPNLAINDREVTASLDPLQKYLEKQNLSRVYANYWT